MHFTHPVPCMVFHNLYRGSTIIPRTNTAQMRFNITTTRTTTAQSRFNIYVERTGTHQMRFNIYMERTKTHQTDFTIREVLQVTN